MKKSIIIQAINEMGLALCNHGHQWSSELRKLYEDSLKELKKKPKAKE